MISYRQSDLLQHVPYDTYTFVISTRYTSDGEGWVSCAWTFPAKENFKGSEKVMMDANKLFQAVPNQQSFKDSKEDLLRAKELMLREIVLVYANIKNFFPGSIFDDSERTRPTPDDFCVYIKMRP